MERAKGNQSKLAQILFWALPVSNNRKGKVAEIPDFYHNFNEVKSNLWILMLILTIS